MASISAFESRGARKELNFEVNMIPMIDLLMVTISFLLLTAVWTHYTRLAADAQAPAIAGATTAPEPPRLHVEMRDPQRFVFTWREGAHVLRSRDVPRKDAVTADSRGGARIVRHPQLAAALAEEWQGSTAHRAGMPDELVLHVGDDLPYGEMIGALDAAYEVKRSCSAASGCSAYHVTFSAR